MSASAVARRMQVEIPPRSSAYIAERVACERERELRYGIEKAGGHCAQAHRERVEHKPMDRERAERDRKERKWTERQRPPPPPPAQWASSSVGYLSVGPPPPRQNSHSFVHLRGHVPHPPYTPVRRPVHAKTHSQSTCPRGRFRKENLLEDWPGVGGVGG